MKKLSSFAAVIFILIIFASIGSSKIFCQSQDSLRSSLNFEWGNNIWGNTYSVGYNYLFSKNVYGGISFGAGSAQFSFDDNGNSFFFEGAPGMKNNFSIEFKQTADLKIGFFFKRKNGLSFFSKFETGISCSHFNFTDEYIDAFRNIWKGSRDFTFYSLLLSLDILKYKPLSDKHLDFCFGFKTRLSVTGREELRYESEKHIPVYIYLIQNGNSSTFWLYPEFFLRINYSI